MQDKWVTTIDINIGLSYNFHISNVLESHSAISHNNTIQCDKNIREEEKMLLVLLLCSIVQYHNHNTISIPAQYTTVCPLQIESVFHL